MEMACEIFWVRFQSIRDQNNEDYINPAFYILKFYILDKTIYYLLT